MFPGPGTIGAVGGVGIVALICGSVMVELMEGAVGGPEGKLTGAEVGKVGPGSGEAGGALRTDPWTDPPPEYPQPPPLQQEEGGV